MSWSTQILLPVSAPSELATPLHVYYTVVNLYALCLQPLNSSGNAMTFSGIPVSSDGHFVTSIPLAMQGSGRVSSSAKVLFEENFDPIPSIP